MIPAFTSADKAIFLLHKYAINYYCLTRHLCDSLAAQHPFQSD